jgi:4-hydroxybutyrate dehydrogenase
MTVINYLTTIIFDHGALAKLPDEMAALGIERPLVVTDEGIVAAGLVDRLQAALPAGAAVPIFDGTPPNPTEAAVLAALDIYKDSDCDSVVAFGGGSSIDLGKGVALLATHSPPLEQYAMILGGVARITPAVAPVIAIPTTAGTGSEVGRGSLLTLVDGRKLGFISPNVLPKRAICDPELSLGLPPGLTAATGMDALTHCVETYISPLVNPPAEAIALDGAGRAFAHIERAVSDGTDREARWHMLMAAVQGGLTFQKGLGAVHSMSHALGGLAEPVLHHGTLNAVILPAVLRYNAGHVGDKYAALTAAMGLGAVADLAAEIEALNARLGLPANLREMGVVDEVVPTMIEYSQADHSTATNPRPLEVADFEALFAASMG